MTIFRHILGLGAAASVLVSCLSSVKPDGRREAITFEPVVGAEVRSGETSEFPEDVSFGIWAVTSEGQTFIDREEVTFDGETWSTASPYYWPEGATLHFYGFAPYEYGMQMNAGGSLVLDAAAPALELVYIFCRKLGIDIGVNMEAVAKINEQLKDIRSELNISVFGADKPAPKPFNPLTDEVPAEVETELERAIKAAKADDFETLLDACHKIEAHFGFPAPNKLVQEAEIPGGMYSNMVAQLKQLNAEDILPRAMELIPTVRLSAGLPPLVTPTSQIVGAQAVNCALDEKAGRAMYTTKNNQFVNLVKGEYGKTPVKIDPEFRFKICGVREETNYDISKYKKQPNPELPEAGGVKLAENEKEELLLELFPLVAKPYLTGVKKAAYEATAAKAGKTADKAEESKAEVKQPVTGKTVTAPLPGKVIDLKVKVGDTVKAGQEVAVLEAMKMENSITSDFGGEVKQILVNEGDNVQTDAVLMIIG